MVLILLVLYGLQLANTIKLDVASHEVSRINDQGLLAIAFFLFAIAREPGSSPAHGTSACCQL
jgi:hypothetical protein